MTMTMSENNPSIMPKLRFPPGSTVAPGDRIGSARDVAVCPDPDGDGGRRGGGGGVYRRGTHVYASLVGTLTLTVTDAPAASDKNGDGGGGLPVVSVIPKKKGGRSRPSAPSQVPFVGQLVLGRVLRVQSQMATVEIVAVASASPGGAAAGSEEGVGVAVALRDPRGGMVRREDVRPGGAAASSSSNGKAEELVMYECYRPGDVIVARILSLGDARRYFLSTDEPQLGVVRATCSCCRGGGGGTSGGGGGGGNNDGTIMVPANWKEMECPVTKDREGRKVAKPSPTPTAGAGQDQQNDEVSKFLKSL